MDGGLHQGKTKPPDHGIKAGDQHGKPRCVAIVRRKMPVLQSLCQIHPAKIEHWRLKLIDARHLSKHLDEVQKAGLDIRFSNMASDSTTATTALICWRY